MPLWEGTVVILPKLTLTLCELFYDSATLFVASLVPAVLRVVPLVYSTPYSVEEGH